MYNRRRMNHPVILFDGVCNYCNALVQFILRRDKRGVFRFAALQSEPGQAYLNKFGLPPDFLDSVVLVEGETCFVRSDAGLRIMRHLGGLWALACAFAIVPRPVRDALYDYVARNRYRWFGRTEACMVPTEEVKARFLD